MSANVTSITARRGRQRAALAEQDVTRRILFLLLGPVAVLLVVGLGALLSASSVPSLDEFGDSLFYLKRQLMWVGAGLVVLSAATVVPYRLYKRWAVPLFVVAIIGLLLVIVAGTESGGSQRWLVVGPLSIQPSEFAKFAVVVVLATAMSRKEAVLEDIGHFAWPVLFALGVSGALVMMQPDLGTALIITAGGMAVLAASAAPLRYVFTTAVIGGAAALFLARVSDYRWDRITAFLDPFADPQLTGYQAVQSLYALGTGGWFGVGLGASRARWAFLPNAHTDFIFAIIGEETGFIGTMAIVVLFSVFTVAGISIAMRAPDAFGRLLASGIVAWLVVQAIVNIGGVTSTLPITGVPLPFLSFGGSALLVELGAVGVLINIALSSRNASKR